MSDNLSPMPGVPQPEQLRTPETLAAGLVDRIERGLTELGVPFRDHRRSGWCNFVPGIVSYCAEDDARRNGYSAQSSVYHVNDLHAETAGLPARSTTEPVWRDAFNHAFNVVSIEGQPFLADLTFAQFLGKDGYLGQMSKEKSGVRNDDPFVNQLMSKGFVPLTDETLREYLRVTTRNPEPDYISSASLAVFDNLEPLDMGSFVDEKEDNLHPDLGTEIVGHTGPQ